MNLSGPADADSTLLKSSEASAPQTSNRLARPVGVISVHDLLPRRRLYELFTGSNNPRYQR